jgi:hypothetical protein
MAAFYGAAFDGNAFWATTFDVGPATVLGPAFTRKRYREILEADEAAREAERKAERLKNEEQRKAALAAVEQARAAFREAQTRRHEQWANENQIRSLEHALDAFNGAKTIAGMMAAAQQMERAATAARSQNEDEALALLMLLH